MDETVVNVHNKPQNTFAKKGERPVQLMNATPIPSITISLAISNCHVKPVFMISNVTNSKEFKTFMSLVAATRIPRYHESEPLYCVLDQHAAHHCDKNGIRQMMKTHYKVLYLPAKSKLVFLDCYEDNSCFNSSITQDFMSSDSEDDL